MRKLEIMVSFGMIRGDDAYKALGLAYKVQQVLHSCDLSLYSEWSPDQQHWHHLAAG